MQEEKVLRILKVVAIFYVVNLIAYNFKRIDILAERFSMNLSIVSMMEVLVTLLAITLLVCVFLFKKLIFLSVVAFLHSIFISVIDGQNLVWIFLYFFGVSVLVVNGFFSASRKIKIFVFSVLLILLLLADLRFGIATIYNILVSKIMCAVVCFLIVYILDYYVGIAGAGLSEKIINISDVDGLSKRDAEWLSLVCADEKYETIAKTYGMSLGSVKNRMNFIYKKLGVKDRNDFLNRYMDFQIIFEPPLYLNNQSQKDIS